MKNSVLTVAAIVAGIAATQAGDITGKVTITGDVPANREFAMDPNCSKLHTEKTHEMPFYVVSKDHGLKDTVVMIVASGKSKGADAAPAIIDQHGCEYMPYVSAVQTGQTITVKNSDPLLHNVHPTPREAGNVEKNVAQPIKGMKNDFVFPTAEKFLRFKCDVHQWMFAYVTVVDNPWFAVTDENGNYTIKDVPDGDYEVVAIHRKVHADLGGETKKVKVSGATKVDFALAVP